MQSNSLGVSWYLTFVIRSVYLKQWSTEPIVYVQQPRPFEQECDKLLIMLTKFCYPHPLIESTIYKFNQIETRKIPCETDPTVYVKLLFKSQQSAEREGREMATPTRIH